MSSPIVRLAFVISILLSIWGILVYELEFNSFGLPFESIKGWSNCAKALSYSIIGGWIIFLLTYELPYQIKRRKIKNTINGDLVNLNKELSSILEKYFDPKHLKTSLYIDISGGSKHEKIIRNAAFISILTQINWETKFDKDNRISYREQMIATILKIITHTTHLNMLYRDYLSHVQERCFEMICRVPLEQNWAVSKLGDITDRIDLQNLVLSIGIPLQKSIGVALPNKIDDIINATAKSI